MYCSVDDVIERVSLVGAMYALDEDESSSIDLSAVQSSIDACATEIDGALARWLNDPDSAIGNEWLRHRCIDLASARLCERKGGRVPDSLERAAERSREMLDEVRAGRYRVPRLMYPIDRRPDALRRFGLPRVQG